MELQKDLLPLLACPRCHGPLESLEENSLVVGLLCNACGLVYPVRENIPVMLTDEAIAVALWNQGVRQVKV